VQLLLLRCCCCCASSKHGRLLLLQLLLLLALLQLSCIPPAVVLELLRPLLLLLLPLPRSGCDGRLTRPEAIEARGHLGPAPRQGASAGGTQSASSIMQHTLDDYGIPAAGRAAGQRRPPAHPPAGDILPLRDALGQLQHAALAGAGDLRAAAAAAALRRETDPQQIRGSCGWPAARPPITAIAIDTGTEYGPWLKG
jgi:hypothetical protein